MESAVYFDGIPTEVQSEFLNNLGVVRLKEFRNNKNKLERDFDHKARDGDFKEFKFNKQGFGQFWKTF